MPGLVEFIVRGRLGAELVNALEGFDVTDGPDGSTRIIGGVVDQARLLGILQAMDDRHIEVVSVNPIAAPTSED